MPVAPNTSVLSRIRNAFQPSSHPNPSAVVPDPLSPAHSLSSASSSSHGPHLLQLYDAFESNLTQNLSALMPMEDSTCVNMASLKQFLRLLLLSQADLNALIPSSHQHPLSQAQTRMMEEFLERSTKLLDVCRAIKEQISDVERSQGMLQLVVSCLSSKSGGMLPAAHIARARKALRKMLPQMEGDKEVAPVHLYRSFRFKSSRDHAAGDSGPDTPVRWGSWHGSSGSLLPNAAAASRQLQALGSVLTVPRLAAGDVEENLFAAIYTLNVMSIFVLGTLTASLPSLNNIYIASFVHPRSFSWASSLSHLQEKVQEELKRRCKKSNGFAGMWELDQMATIVERLFELTEEGDFSLGEKAREEVKNLVKQLRQHVEELDRDLGHLYAQLMDFYGQIISSRMEILNVLREYKA